MLNETLVQTSSVSETAQNHLLNALLVKQKDPKSLSSRAGSGQIRRCSPEKSVYPVGSFQLFKNLYKFIFVENFKLITK